MPDDLDTKQMQERDRLIARLGDRTRGLRTTTYVGVVRKAAGSDFAVEFPDLPGCMIVGKTMHEARRMAAEALAVHLEDMVAHGLAVPIARDLRTIRDDPAGADATTLILVEVPTKPN